jgi:hypothetical protein
LSNIRQIGVALKQYAVENRNQYPPPGGTLGTNNGGPSRQPSWDIAIAKYLGMKITWNWAGNLDVPNNYQIGVFKCPFDEVQYTANRLKPRRSYALIWASEQSVADNPNSDREYQNYYPPFISRGGGRWGPNTLLPDWTGAPITGASKQYVILADYIWRSQEESQVTLFGRVDWPARGLDIFYGDWAGYRSTGHMLKPGINEHSGFFNDGHAETLIFRPPGTYEEVHRYFDWWHRYPARLVTP